MTIAPEVKAARTEAVIFDFDGVLVESVDVKTRAFAALYAEYGPAVVEKVVAHHLAHGGVSRYEKFRHCHQAFLGRALSVAEGARLAERFAVLVEDAVVAARWVQGAFEFLQRNAAVLPLFVVSGTPDEELKRIVLRRGMSHYFISVHGAPADKTDLVDTIVRRHRYAPERVLMVGDSLTDYESAMAAGVKFVGRAADGSSPFPHDTTVIADLGALSKYL